MAISDYRIGVLVRCLANSNEGKEGVVVDNDGEYVYVAYTDCSEGNSRKPDKYYKIISGCEKNKQPEQKMSLISKLMLSLKSEPEKSFIKAGISNADGTFTCEGKELWLNWMFQDEAVQARFNTEVVQPLLAQMKEESGCK